MFDFLIIWIEEFFYLTHIYAISSSSAAPAALEGLWKCGREKVEREVQKVLIMLKGSSFISKFTTKMIMQWHLLSKRTSLCVTTTMIKICESMNSEMLFLVHHLQQWTSVICLVVVNCSIFHISFWIKLINCLTLRPRGFHNALKYSRN